MLKLFPTKPPLSTRQRVELELLMRQCAGRVGEDVIRQTAVITNWTDLALDLDHPGSLLMTAAAEVRRRMKLTDVDVPLEISDHNSIEASSCYQAGPEPIIRVAIETLQDPLRTITSLAHEYGHHILQSDPAASAAGDDERLADLLPLCYGFGVLQSDASLYFANWSMGEWAGWKASKAGYLNAQQIGYALALFARVRGETNPSWMRWLRADSRVTLKQAIKYFRHLQKIDGASLFDAPRIPDVGATLPRLAQWISGDDPAFALAAAWRLCALDQFDAPTIEALHTATHSSDPDLVPVVIGLLAGADDRDQATRDRVGDLLRDRRPQVALAAAKAAYGLGLDLHPHIGTLAWLLDKFQHDPYDVLQVIAVQGAAASGIDENLCRMLKRSIKSLDDRRTMALLDCLGKISQNPEQSIKSTLSAGPIRDEAIEWLERQQE